MRGATLLLAVVVVLVTARQKGSARAGLDEADLREGRGRAVLGLHKIDLDVVNRARLVEARGWVLGAFAEAIQGHGAVVGLEANAVIWVVCEDVAILASDHFASLQAVNDRLHDLLGGHPEGLQGLGQEALDMGALNNPVGFLLGSRVRVPGLFHRLNLAQAVREP